MATMIHRMRVADRARYKELEGLLSRHGGTLRSRKQSLRNGLPTATSGVMDVEEHSLDAEEQDVSFSVLELTSQTVQEIERALERLGIGDFGTCSDCRAKIPAARLRALPFATLCRACQERRDSDAGGALHQPAAEWSERVAFNHLRSVAQ
jgi:RNA polymerase-binding transcription factor DksA